MTFSSENIVVRGKLVFLKSVAWSHFFFLFVQVNILVTVTMTSPFAIKVVHIVNANNARMISNVLTCLMKKQQGRIHSYPRRVWVPAGWQYAGQSAKKSRSTPMHPNYTFFSKKHSNKQLYDFQIDWEPFTG